MHVIKIAHLYLTPDGTWSESQADALKVDATRDALQSQDRGQIRTVKLVPFGSLRRAVPPDSSFPRI